MSDFYDLAKKPHKIRPPSRYSKIYDVLVAHREAGGLGMTALEIATAIGIRAPKRYAHKPNISRWVSGALSRLHTGRNVIRHRRPGRGGPSNPYMYLLRPDDPEGKIFWKNKMR